MKDNIGNFVFDKRINRSELTSHIRSLVDNNYSVGLHAIGFVPKSTTKLEIASKISKEGIKLRDNLSMYSTVRFFGKLCLDNQELNEYIYDQADPNEIVIVVAIPDKYRHSSGAVINGGEFRDIPTSDYKFSTNEYHTYANLTDSVVCPIPTVFILGCYTFNRNDVKHESRTVEKRINGRVEYQIDPYYKLELGDCDFYLNPMHYKNLSQEQHDYIIETCFKNELDEINQKKEKEQPKIKAIRRHWKPINEKKDLEN